MPNGKRNKYGIFLNGELIKEGFCYEISRYLHIHPNIMRNYAHDGKPLGDYLVKITEVIDQKYVKKEPKKDFDALDYLYRHLKEYGNTVLNDDPSEYLEELEERLNGTIFVRKAEDVDDMFNYEASVSEKPHRHGRRRNYYILEIKYGLPKV